jgi:hypothetical protein
MGRIGNPPRPNIRDFAARRENVGLLFFFVDGIVGRIMSAPPGPRLFTGALKRYTASCNVNQSNRLHS